MKKWHKNTPEGTRDLLYRADSKKNEIESALHALFQSHAFAGVRTPSFEFYDVYTTGSDVLPQENMYKLVDRHGRLLAMRADTTAPIMRVVQTRLSDEALPLRFCYTQNVFRANYGLNGQRHEITQSGVEFIGAAGMKADLEMLVLAIDAMKASGIHDFKLEIGSVTFFKALTGELPLAAHELEEIRALIEAKNFAALGDRLSSLRRYESAYRALTALPQLFGGEEVFAAAAQIAYNEQAREVLDYLASLYQALVGMGLGDALIVDLGMVQRLHYYTGLVFRGFVNGSGDAILSGGRYDTLAENFGRALPAIGFAVDVDSVLDVVMEGRQRVKADGADILLHYEPAYAGKAYEYAGQMIAAGKVCELSPCERLDESKAYAIRRGIACLYAVGETITPVSM